MKVSALIVTYNQERFIADAIESALKQETDFSYEIVISEDCSTDGTRAIVQEYEAHHPDRIRALYSPSNLGGVANFVAAWAACRGEWVALLEGDDYWTSERKVQRQVDFLEAHPECSMCVHGATQVYVGEDREPTSWMNADLPEVATLDDLLLSNFVHTCTAMLRRDAFTDFAPWVYDAPMSDIPLWVEVAKRGHIGVIDEFMAVYRVHDGGVWSGKDALTQVEQIIELYERLNEELGYQYDQTLQRTLARFRAQLACEHAGLPRETKLLVLSQGDDELLKLRRRTRHFPNDAQSRNPRASEVVRELAQLRGQGWRFLVVPARSKDWLGSQTALVDRLERTAEVVWQDRHTTLYDLGETTPSLLGRLRGRRV